MNPAFERLIRISSNPSAIEHEGAVLNWDNAERRRYQPQRRLSPIESNDLCTAYQSGNTIRELTAEFGIHKTTVTAVLERAGIARRIRTISIDEVDQAIDLYASGLSTATIGAQLGFSAETIRSSLMRNGVQLRPRRGWVR